MGGLTKNGRIRLGSAGFTLVEMIAVTAIIAVGLAAIILVLVEGADSSDRVERWTRDVFLSQTKLEDIRGKILGTNPAYGFDKDYNEPAAAYPSYPGYYYTVVDDTDGDMKELVVTVWFDKDGGGALDAGEQSVALDTKIAKRD